MVYMILCVKSFKIFEKITNPLFQTNSHIHGNSLANPAKITTNLINKKGILISEVIHKMAEPEKTFNQGNCSASIFRNEIEIRHCFFERER